MTPSVVGMMDDVTIAVGPEAVTTGARGSVDDAVESVEVTL